MLLNTIVKTAGDNLCGVGVVASRSFGTRKYIERQVEKRKCMEGHSVSPIKDQVGWSEKMASVSEASVKADQAPERPVSEMQADTLQYLKADNGEPNIVAGDHYNIAGSALDDDFEDEEYYYLSSKYSRNE